MIDVTKEKKRFTVISLFSGCGGLDKGFEGDFKFLDKHYEQHPFKVIFANDIMNQACETFKTNFDISEENVFCGDIEELIDINPEIIPQADIVTGGFPCQDFSLAGKRVGFKSKRGKLYQQMKRVIEISKPKIFIAENVKGLTTLGKALSIIKRDFANSNPKYKVDHKLLMAADYGVPQRRERVIIVGIREDVAEKLNCGKKRFKFPFPEPTHSMKTEGDLPIWISAKNAIGDLDEVNKIMDRQNEYSKAKNYGSHLQGNKPIDADRPSPTIRAEHHGNIEFHYKAHRRLSVRECARIQSFPDDFKFYGSASNVYVQIGNAVPPLLGWHVANSVKNVLEEYKKA